MAFLELGLLTDLFPLCDTKESGLITRFRMSGVDHTMETSYEWIMIFRQGYFLLTVVGTVTTPVKWHEEVLPVSWWVILATALAPNENSEFFNIYRHQGLKSFLMKFKVDLVNLLAGVHGSIKTCQTHVWGRCGHPARAVSHSVRNERKIQNGRLLVGLKKGHRVMFSSIGSSLILWEYWSRRSCAERKGTFS